MSPPINDNFASAIALSTTLPGTRTGDTTVDATSEVGEPSVFFGEDDSHSVWYTFTPSHTGIYRFYVHNALDDIVWSDFASYSLTLYSGSTIGGLTVIQRVLDNNTGPPVGHASVRQILTSGITYYICVASPHYTSEALNAHSVNFDLDWDEITSPGTPPANDDLANAEDLGLDPTGTFSGTTIDASNEAWEYPGYTLATVWYKFSVDFTGTQTVTLTKTGTDPDWEPYGEIYTILNDPPADFDDLSFYDYIGNDVSPPGGVASTNMDFVPGDYYLVVYDWYGSYAWDDFDLTFSAFSVPPVNDNFANRIHLPYSYKACETGTTSGATTESSEPVTNPGAVGPHPSVWYEWTPPNYSNEPMDFQIDTLGSVAETYLEVFTGNDFFSPLVLIESDHNSGAGGKSQLTLNTNGDVNYKIRVSSPITSEGTFNLNITALPGGSPPTNDDFANAELLTGYDDSTSGTTVGATAECGEPLGGDFYQETTNSVWYKWIPPQTGRVRIALTASSGLALTLVRGTTLTNIVAVQGFLISSNGVENYDYVSVEGGVEYYFNVQGIGGTEATFSLAFHMSSVGSPANDDPANAQVISVSFLTGTINPVTEGANWDSVGPYTGDFITNAQEEITVWYKFTANRSGSVTFTKNSETVYNSDFTNDLSLNFYSGATPSNLTSEIAISISVPTATRTFNVYAGETYWIAATTYTWATASDVDYSFTFQDDNTEGTFPDPSGGSTGDFDSTTGTFVADSEDNEFVASGGVGYGTISPWTSPGTHYPYGWWTRFDIRSTSGDFLYRFGQTQQFIEIFRATKTGGDYESIVIVGHKEGYQSIGYSVNGGTITDTGYKVWGGNAKTTTGKIRIEVGENGLTIDGRCYLHNFDDPFFVSTHYFRDSGDDQFVTFDYGIRSYPGDGSAYVDLDPEWNFRYSNIALHDNPEINVLGDADTSFKEVGLIEGWTTGQFLQRSGSASQISFRAMDDDFPPTVIIAPAEYSNGFAIDCTVAGTSLPELTPRGAQWIGADRSLWQNKFCEPPADSYYPGISFGFYITDFPSSTSIIAFIYNQGEDNNYNGFELHVGSDGTLYIRPARDSDLIPFCRTEENKWNYIELQGDFHTRTYATKIWLDNFYMGRFETTYVPASTNRVPLRPIQPNIYGIGRLSVTIPMGICFRDVAITRCKKDRPLGPTTIVSRKLNGVGTHNYFDPDEEDLPSVGVLDIAGNGDFSAGTDGAGQPHYWTGYDRHDSGVPAGAMKLNYLFQTFGDSLVDTVTDGSGPPGHTGETAMRITAVAQDGTGGDENYSQAAYVFGGATSPAIDLTYHYAYADTLSMQFWIKGIAGQNVRMDAESGIGGWSGWNSHTMSGEWEFVKLLLEPMSASTGGDNLSAVTLGFPDSSPGDEFLIKAFHLYVNPDNIDASFWRTEDDGATVTRISAASDVDSWELIDEFPPSDGSDHVYLNTYDLKTGVKGKENDGKTHLPPMMSDAYLEYTFGGVDVDDDNPIYSAKILMGQKGFSGPTGSGSVNWENYVEGVSNIIIALADEQRRYGGAYHSGIHISDEEPALFGFTLTRPPGDGPWTINKWNDFVIRLMSHEILFTGNSLQIYNDYTNSAAIQGVWAEILMYDRRLVPPTCVKPVDLSRIRFRAHQDGDA